jgi:hypothetical protein
LRSVIAMWVVLIFVNGGGISRCPGVRLSVLVRRGTGRYTALSMLELLLEHPVLGDELIERGNLGGEFPSCVVVPVGWH